MQTRRDLYQAHRLMMQRVGLALLQGEPDVAESPMRRLSVAAFSGAMLAVVIAAIFGVIGLISPGGARGLDTGNKIIIEKETGTKYIFDTNKHQMRPVLNYASARLAVPTDNPEQRVVSRKSLAKYTRGPMIGIAGAPDSLPDAGHLVKKPWSVCVRNGQTALGGNGLVTSLVAGTNVGGRELDPGHAIAVQSADQTYVIWHNKRMHMPVQGNAASIVLRGVTPAPVSQSWLDPIEEGAEFAAPPVPQRGRPVQGIVPGARIGQIFQTKASGTTLWYVLVAQGFARISETQATLLLADPQTDTRAYAGRSAVPLDIDAGRVTVHQAQSLLNEQLPQTLPQFDAWDGSTPLCSVYANTDQGSVTARLAIGGSLPYVQAATTGQGDAVDQVLLPPGRAALVGLLPGEGQLAAINSWYVVSDAGISFPLSSKDTAKKLGYDVANAAPVPKAVLSLIPTGPTLDPSAAIKPVPPPMSSG